MHPMLQESCDEAMSCAQIEYDQQQAGHTEPPTEPVDLDALPF